MKKQIHAAKHKIKMESESLAIRRETPFLSWLAVLHKMTHIFSYVVYFLMANYENTGKQK